MNHWRSGQGGVEDSQVTVLVSSIMNHWRSGQGGVEDSQVTVLVSFHSGIWFLPNYLCRECKLML